LKTVLQAFQKSLKSATTHYIMNLYIKLIVKVFEIYNKNCQILKALNIMSLNKFPGPNGEQAYNNAATLRSYVSSKPLYPRMSPEDIVQKEASLEKAIQRMIENEKNKIIIGVDAYNSEKRKIISLLNISYKYLKYGEEFRIYNNAQKTENRKQNKKNKQNRQERQETPYRHHNIIPETLIKVPHGYSISQPDTIMTVTGHNQESIDVCFKLIKN
jgi:hypothetical protein